MQRLVWSDSILSLEGGLRFKRYFDFFPYKSISNWWDALGGAGKPIYVVQTNEEIVKRCILMTTDPGDLVLDPTCGSGTTAYVAEQWGRRWITTDTSRVALALGRTRLMSARYSYYLLRDSDEGASKEAELSGRAEGEARFRGDVRRGFVNRRELHITSSAIANNAEIDVIWERWQPTLESLRGKLNAALRQSWEDWQVPRAADEKWPAAARAVHREWWDLRRKRQAEIDESIARAAASDPIELYDRPYEAKNTVRVTGPFTVESLSPHRVLPTDE